MVDTLPSGMTFVDTSRQPYPEPCGDCGREYLRGERVEWRTPTVEPNQMRLVWDGCVDCFVIRTRPGVRPELESKESNG